MIEYQVVEESIERGWRFLESQSKDGSYACYEHATHDKDVERHGQLTPRESFSSVVVAETLIDYRPDGIVLHKAIDYLAAHKNDGLFTFFEDPTICPPDADITSLGYIVLYQAGKTDKTALNKAATNILAAADAQGNLQVWLDPHHTRPNRKDAVVTANALRLLYTAGRKHEALVAINEAWLDDVLNSNEFLQGTRYYPSPDAFLYFVGKFALSFSDARSRYEDALRKALLRRIGTTEHAIDIAMRVTLSVRLGLRSTAEAETAQLLALQHPEGWWPADTLYRGMQRNFGSRAVATAFSLGALSELTA